MVGIHSYPVSVLLGAIAVVGRRMSELLGLVLLTWCWLANHCTVANRANSSQMTDDNEADIFLTTPELITKYGYPIETHSVQTEEGYILELHRIPHGESGAATSGGPAVLIHHALLCSSFDWVVMGPGKAFGLILADAGYDVWLANARGNTYSRKHVSLDPSAPKFWEFSWHEMGIYDVPAEIDYILATTGQKKLIYIGHSMGTTMFFVMMSQRPEYNEKILAMIALAPIAIFTPTNNPVFRFMETVRYRFLKGLFNAVGMGEFLPQNGILNHISRVACRHSAFTNRFCVDFIFYIVGKSTQLDKKRLVVMLSHNPAGASPGELLHFAQGGLSGEFRMYDFGEEKNMDLYGQVAPPQYNLGKVTAPVALYYSDNDKLAPEYNVNRIFNALPNVIGKFRVPLKTFNHLDFMWGKESNTILFKDVINIMKKYEGDVRT